MAAVNQRREAHEDWRPLALLLKQPRARVLARRLFANRPVSLEVSCLDGPFVAKFEVQAQHITKPTFRAEAILFGQDGLFGQSRKRQRSWKSCFAEPKTLEVRKENRFEAIS
jgi:hypothetical protein